MGPRRRRGPTPAVRQPAIFVPHGGGPCFWMDWPPPFGPHAWDGLRGYLAGLVKSLRERPKAFLIVTADWEADKPTVSVNPKPDSRSREKPAEPSRPAR